MSNAPGAAATLQQWLDRIQQLHPQEIELGLDRVQQVAGRLLLQRPAPLVVTVTGTNGKGSHVATLDALFRAHGLRVGCYTSPHLLRYNERVCINGIPVSDQLLVQAFDRIDAARGDISLTFFEFGTLAALLIFADAALDVAVLEVGMGGRLDAVNIVDADIAVVTHIDLDHQAWLGDTRELIAIEKAGIFRAGKPVVCSEQSPPVTLLAAAEALGCRIFLAGRDFDCMSDQSQATWTWHGVQLSGAPLQLRNLPIPALALSNVAGALQAAVLSGLSMDTNKVAAAITDQGLRGRQQWYHVSNCRARVMLDVAHNPHAAGALAERLTNELGGPAHTDGRVHMVLAMMADKDHTGFYRALENRVDFWYIAHFKLERCLPAVTLAERWRELSALSGRDVQLQVFDSVVQAFDNACQQASERDIIVVCGSFVTVAEVMAALETRV